MVQDLQALSLFRVDASGQVVSRPDWVVAIPDPVSRVRMLLTLLLRDPDDIDVDTFTNRLLSLIPQLAELPDETHPSLLVVYPDQVRSPMSPRSPLSLLNEAFNRWWSPLATQAHVLPFYPSSSDGGFAPLDHEQVDPALGSWDDLGDLASRFPLTADLVVNHVSASHPWVRSPSLDSPRVVGVEEDFDTSNVFRPRGSALVTHVPGAGGVPRPVWTTFSPDQVDLDVTDPHTVEALVRILGVLLSRGVTRVRLDAVGYVGKELGSSCFNTPTAHVLVALFRALLDANAPMVELLAEVNGPGSSIEAYVADGEADLVYQFTLPPLVLDAFNTGDTGPLFNWISSPKAASPRRVNFLATHDGVGLTPVEGLLEPSRLDSLIRNMLARGARPMLRSTPQGERIYELDGTWASLLSPSRVSGVEAANRLVASHGLLLGLPGVPLMYALSLYARSSDVELSDSTGNPRDLNRSRFTLPMLESWSTPAFSREFAAFTGLAELVAVRAACPALSMSAPLFPLTSPFGTVAWVRSHPSQRVAVVVNVSGVPQRVPLPSSKPMVLAGLGRVVRGGAVDVPPYRTVWVDL